MAVRETSIDLTDVLNINIWNNILQTKMSFLIDSAIYNLNNAIRYVQLDRLHIIMNNPLIVPLTEVKGLVKLYLQHPDRLDFYQMLLQLYNNFLQERKTWMEDPQPEWPEEANDIYNNSQIPHIYEKYIRMMITEFIYDQLDHEDIGQTIIHFKRSFDESIQYIDELPSFPEMMRDDDISNILNFFFDVDIAEDMAEGNIDDGLSILVEFYKDKIQKLYDTEEGRIILDNVINSKLVGFQDGF